MSKARNLADVISGAFDVPAGALDNVEGLPDAIDVNASAPANSLAIDASGNVGIGTSTSVDTLLHLRDLTANDGPVIRLEGSGSNAQNQLIGGIEWENTDTSGDGPTVTGAVRHYSANTTGAGGYTTFHTHDGSEGGEGSDAPERMRLDSSGNLLVGTTNTEPGIENTNTGITFNGTSGRIIASRSGGIPLYINRSTSAGDIVQFRKDGSTIASIRSHSGTTSSSITLNTTASTGVGLFGSTSNGGTILPADGTGNAVDAVKDLGRSNVRWDDIYAANGTISTSDRNEKQDIEELSEAEQRVAVACKGLIRKFRWINAVEKKGDDARIHFGIIAQDLQAAFEAEGLDAHRYAMFTSNTWWEAEETYTDDEGVEQTRINTYDTADEAPEGATERTRLGVRYPELLAFIIGAL